MNVASSTVTGSSGGGIVHSGASNFGLDNTIVANTNGSDLRIGGGHGGTFSGSFNLIEDGTTLGLTNSLTGDPMLGDLADNGGATQTHSLLPGSPAIDAGDPSIVFQC